MKWLYLSVAIIVEVIATSALKASAGFTKLIPSVIVVIGYGATFWLLSLTLKVIPVGITYAIWSGVGIVLISIIGWTVFGQTLDLPAVIGIVFIIAGVALIYLKSNSMSP